MLNIIELTKEGKLIEVYVEKIEMYNIPSGTQRSEYRARNNFLYLRMDEVCTLADLLKQTLLLRMATYEDERDIVLTSKTVYIRTFSLSGMTSIYSHGEHMMINKEEMLEILKYVESKNKE
jgi:hypothetical protein